MEDIIKEFADWTNDIDQEIMSNYIAPIHISVDGKVVDGETTFLYQGYVTDTDGNKIEFYKENTFGAELVSQDEMFK